MKSIFNGTVFDGGLRLDERIELADQSRVQITVIPLANWRQRWRQALSALSALQRDRPINSGGVRFSRDELHERG
jgi:hypothetical protein